MNDIVESIESAAEVVEILQKAGYQAVFAGGCVRDFLLEVEPNDIDIATSATPDQVEALFPKTVAVGKSFGVIRVQHSDYEFEVATFRKDSKESDGRRPDSVEFSNMFEDAQRRDLTINAMFFDPFGDKYIDYVGGQTDLNRKMICMVGNPAERIAEDKLRLLRVVRFASRMGWNIESRTRKALQEFGQDIVVVSPERMGEELTKILTDKRAHVGFGMLKEFGFWTYIMPQISELKECAQDPKWHPEGDVFVHTQLMLKNAGQNLRDNAVLAWAIVMHDIGKPATYAIGPKGNITAHGHAEKGARMAEELLPKLRFDTKTIQKVVWIVENHMKLFDFKNMKQASRMKLIANENFDNLLELHRLDCLSSNGDLSSYEFIKHIQSSTPISQIKPERLIDGKDVMAMGVKPGKMVGKILEEIADQQREGKVTTKEQAVRFAQALIEQDDREKAEIAAQ